MRCSHLGLADMTEGLTETIEKLKAEISGHVQDLKTDPHWLEIEKLYKALNTIEGLAEQPATSLVQLFGIESETDRGVSIKRGEFHGLEPVDAAKRYLKKKGLIGDKAVPLDDIMEALEKGDLKADRDAVRISLSRSTWDVVKVNEDVYGLVEFYPHLKRGKKGKAAKDNAEAQESGPGETPAVE